MLTMMDAKELAEIDQRLHQERFFWLYQEWFFLKRGNWVKWKIVNEDCPNLITEVKHLSLQNDRLLVDIKDAEEEVARLEEQRDQLFEAVRKAERGSSCICETTAYGHVPCARHILMEAIRRCEVGGSI